jgi:hypothetical protein
MTARDHATKPFEKVLRERGHPYMACSIWAMLTKGEDYRIPAAEAL